MKDYILYRKITRIIIQLSEELQISPKRAMLIFYNSTVGQQLHDPKYGYQIMSDTYIVNDIKAELTGRL
ncbi:MAG: DUF3791 domain-containing protein [Candidatus Coprenecus sp.]